MLLLHIQCHRALSHYLKGSIPDQAYEEGSKEEKGLLSRERKSTTAIGGESGRNRLKGKHYDYKRDAGKAGEEKLKHIHWYLSMRTTP